MDRRPISRAQLLEAQIEKIKNEVTAKLEKDKRSQL